MGLLASRGELKMKKSLELTIFLLCLVLGSSVAFGQWAATYGYGNSSDEAMTAIYTTESGGYLVSGWTSYTGSHDVWLLELDSDGNVARQKAYGGPLTNRGSAHPTSDGGYILSMTSNHFSDLTEEEPDIWIVKLDNNWQIQWQRAYGGPGDDQGTIRETSDGGYIISGYTNSFTNGNYDVWVLKLNATGGIEWQYTYGGPMDDLGSSPQETSDGGYIVPGRTESFGVDTPDSSARSDIWLLKLNAFGDLEWTKTYGGNQYDSGTGLVQTETDEYLLYGYSTSFSTGACEIWVLKLDSNGAITWERTYGETDVGEDAGYFPSSIRRVADGYIVAGQKLYMRGDLLGTHDGLIVKLDNSGDVEWTKLYGLEKSDWLSSIKALDDGGYIAAGWTDSFVPGFGNGDGWILKMNQNGEIDPSCTFIRAISVSTQASSAIVTEPDVVSLETYITPSEIDVTVTETNVTKNLLCQGTPPEPLEGWPMFGHDASRTGYTDSPAPSTVNEANLVWQYTTGGSVRSSPAVADNKLFIGSHDHKIYALDALSGQLIWEYPVGASGIVESSPVVADGMVILGAYDGILRALDKDNGGYIWGKSLGDIFSSPVIADGLVFVGTLSGKMYALYANTGDIKWEKSFAEQIFSSPAVADGKVFFGSGSYPSAGKLYCLLTDSGDSCPGWSGPFSPVPSGAVVSSPAVADGKVFFGCNNGWVYALDQDNGSLIWSFETGGLVSSSPAIADGLVFVSSKDGNLYAFDADPSDGVDEGNEDPSGVPYDLIWSQNIGEAGIDLSSSPAVADGKVFIGSYDHKIYAFDALDGSIVSTYQTDGPIWSSPAIQDGMLYIGSEDHNIYAFGGNGLETVKFRGEVLVNRPIISFYSIDIEIDEILDDPAGQLAVGDVVTAWSHRDSPAQVEDPVVGDEVEVLGLYYGHDVRGGYESDYVDLETSSHYLTIRKAALPAVQDTYVSSAYPNENFGWEDRLNIVNIGTAMFERAYLQFDLSSLPSGVSIAKAELQLSLAGLDGQDEIGAYSVSSNWGESQTTWNNQPPAASTPESSTLVSYDQPAGEFVWDVTNLARMWKDSPLQNHGIMLRSTSEPTSTATHMKFYSREESVYIEKTPKLVLYFSAETSVNFPDPNLEQAIRETIDKPTGDIYSSDLVGLTELYASERGISNLTGLEHCTNLEYLDLGGNQISDISALAMLTKLQVAVLWDNQIVDTTPLSGLTSLLGLALNANQISDITSLSAFTNLVILWLGNNNISGITPLAGLTHLGDAPYGAAPGTINDSAKNQTPVADPTRLSSFCKMFKTTPDQTATSRDDACDYPALGLSNNLITDIQPLVNNIGIGSGDVIDLRENFLDLTPGSQDMQNLEALQGRGTTVCYEPQRLTPAVFRVEGSTGNVYSDASYYGQSFESGSADVAEWVPVSEPVEPGDVLELDPDRPHCYRKARGPCSTLVTGVVSSNPGVILGSELSTHDSGLATPDRALLALLGIVPVKVTDEGGPIQPGDLLTTSSTPGHAMRWDPDAGSPCDLVGKALEPWESGRGEILVLLMH